METVVGQESIIGRAGAMNLEMERRESTQVVQGVHDFIVDLRGS